MASSSPTLLLVLCALYMFSLSDAATRFSIDPLDNVVAGSNDAEDLVVNVFALNEDGSRDRDFDASVTLRIVYLVQGASVPGSFTTDIEISRGRESVDLIDLLSDAPNTDVNTAQDITFSLEDRFGTGLNVDSTVSIILFSGGASDITIIASATSPTVGQSITLSATVEDANGNIAVGYSGNFGVLVTGGSPTLSSSTLDIDSGLGSVAISSLTSQAFNVSLTDVDNTGLTMPSAPLTISFLPGDVAELVIQHIPPVSGTNTVSVTIYALDVYGNINTGSSLSITLDAEGTEGTSSSYVANFNEGVAIIEVTGEEAEIVSLSLRNTHGISDDVDVSSEGSVTFSVVCNGVTEYQDEVGQISCKPMSDPCRAGAYAEVPGTPSTNRVCADCDGVTGYQDEDNQNECKAIRDVCEAGFYETVSPSFTSDRECTSCILGLTYQSAANQFSCENVTQCTEGQEVVTAETTSSDRSCRLCPVGMYDHDSDPATPCLSCGTSLQTSLLDDFGGTFQVVFSQASDTVQQTTIEVASSDPSIATFTVDSAGHCADASLSIDSSFSGPYDATTSTFVVNASLLSSSTNVAARVVTLFDGSGTVIDCSQLAPITGRTFSAEEGSLACSPTIDCAAGEGEVVAPSASNNRECAECPSGTFQPLPDQRVCRSVTQCPVGKFDAVPASNTTDVVCDDVTCAGIDTVEYGSITTCSGSVPYLHTCNITCDSSRGFIISGAASFSCGAAGSFTPSPATCVCEDSLFLDPVLGECVASCPEGTWNNNGVCETCTDACVDGVSYEAQACTVSTNRVCTTCSGCPSGLFDTREGCRGSTDTLCASHYTCAVDEYEIQAPNATHNRVCTTCSACSASEYASSGCCADFDTVCSTRRVCDEDEFVVSAALDADTVCQKHTVCGQGTYMSFAGNTTHDVVCEPCSMCPTGFYRAGGCSGESDSVCLPYSSCEEGSFEAIPGTEVTDVTCVTCMPCHEQSEYRSGGCVNSTDSICSLLTVCDPMLEFESVAKTTVSDRVCSNCTTCSEGTFVLSACNGERNTICSTFTDEDACPRGTVLVGDSTQNTCVSCHDCPEGSWASQGPSCPQFFFSPVCSDWSDCDAGQYEVSPPTHTSDRICATCPACPPDHFRPSSACSVDDCVPASTCPFGTYVAVDVSAAADRVCADCTICPEGYYADGGCDGTIDTICHPHRKCSTAEYVTDNGGAFINAACGSCSAILHDSCPDRPFDVCSGEDVIIIIEDDSDDNTTATPTTTTTQSPGPITSVSFELNADYDVWVSTRFARQKFIAEFLTYLADTMNVDKARIDEFNFTRSADNLISVSFDLLADDRSGATERSEAVEALETSTSAFSFASTEIELVSGSISSASTDEEVDLSASSGNSGDNTGAIIGGVIGAVLFIIIAAEMEHMRKHPHHDNPLGYQYSHRNSVIALQTIEAENAEKDSTSEGAAVSEAVFSTAVSTENERLQREMDEMRSKLKAKKASKKEQQKSRARAEQILDHAIASKIDEENDRLQQDIAQLKKQVESKRRQSKFQRAATVQAKLRAEKAALEEELLRVEEVNAVAESALSELKDREAEAEVLKQKLAEEARARREMEEQEAARKRKEEERAQLEAEMKAMQERLAQLGSSDDHVGEGFGGED